MSERKAARKGTSGNFPMWGDDSGKLRSYYSYNNLLKAVFHKNGHFVSSII
jgi:hypothetical protein